MGGEQSLVYVYALLLSMCLLLLVVGSNLGQECVASLLGISEEHEGVGLVEHRVGHISITSGHGPLHDDCVLGLPYLVEKE